MSTRSSCSSVTRRQAYQTTGYEVESHAERHSSDQAWFWTPEWQEGEREVDEAIATGDLSRVFTSADDMFADLDDDA